MRCPLPIDWLEYVEGASSEELTVHLRECRPCQLLVEDLRRELPGRPKLRIAPLHGKGSWPRWHEAKAASPVFGEIWWSARSLGSSKTPMARVPLLIASEPWQEEGHSWFDVIPLSTDIESATSLDLVLLRGDTDLEVPWRVFLRHQSVAERGELDARIGTLTQAGRTILENAIAGRASEERFGSPIEGPYDERIRLPEGMESAVRLLGQTYAQMLEDDSSQEKAGRVLVFEMKRSLKPESATERLSLAADTALRQPERSWVVEIPHIGLILGRIDHRYSEDEDELLFVVEEADVVQAGSPPTVWIVVWSNRLTAPITSQPFVPAAGEKVSLTRGQGIFPGEISRVELSTSDES